MKLFFERERMLLLEACHCGHALLYVSYNIIISYFSIRMPRYLSMLLDWLETSFTTSIHIVDRWMLTFEFY